MPLWKTFRKSVRRSKLEVNGHINGVSCDNEATSETCPSVDGEACPNDNEEACPNPNEEVSTNTNEVTNGHTKTVCTNGNKTTPLVPLATTNTLTNGTGELSMANGRETISKQHQRESKLLVVVKDFTGTTKKEMTVHRGQVVQRQYNCGTWICVQNVNGDNGYIPTEVCCPKDEVEDSMWCQLNREESVDGIYEKIDKKINKPEKSEEQTATSTAQDSTVPSSSNHGDPQPNHTYPPPTRAFPYNSMSSTTSTSLSRQSSKSTYPDTPHSNGAPQRVPVRKLSGTPMGMIEFNESSPVPRYSIEHILHPLHPLSITHSHMSSESSPTGRRRSSLDSGSINPSTPAIQPLLAHTRNDSYLEAVVERDEGTPSSKVPFVAVRRPSRPADLPMLPLPSHLTSNNRRLDTIMASNNGVNTAQQMLESSQMSCLVDDVFLPSEQKPVGIYEVMKSYEKQAEGEVSVSKGEYVIAMQMGYGHWASIITSANVEGLVPQGYLCRYSPLSRRSKGVSMATQTELIIMAPVVHHQQSNVSSASSSGVVTTTGPSGNTTGTNDRDIVRIRDIRPTSTPKKRHGNDIVIQTDSNHSSIYPADSTAAWDEDDDRLDSTEEFWYENSMSIPRLPQNNSMFTNEAPSVCTLPTLNGVVNPVRGEAPLAFHSSRESLPQFPLKNTNGYNIARNTTKPAANQVETFSPMSLRRTLKEQSDWPLSPGILSNASEFSHSPRSPQMVVLRATKSFTPDIDGTDYLPLNKGDILHLIPGHNPYKGWLWVHHVRQRCYGYVPKTHVTNACSQELRHKNGVTMYDEV